MTLNAIDEAGYITAHGRKLATLPLPPNLAHMVVMAAKSGRAFDAATVALLLQERGLGGRGDDIETRFERFSKERGGRTEAAKGLVRRIGAMVEQSAERLPLSVGAMVAIAYPGRVAKRRDEKGENWLSAMGRGLRLDPASPLASAEWLAVADIQGAASGARILSAAALTETQILVQFAKRIETQTDVRYDKVADRVEARVRRRLGAIILSEGQAIPDADATAQALLNAVLEGGLQLLPWSDAALALRQRAEFAGVDSISDEALLRSAADWLRPILVGQNRLRNISRSGLSDALDQIIGWDVKQQIDRIAPSTFKSPAGTAHAIDYAADAGPIVELRVQALFGIDEHPVVGIQRIPLVLSLTSPAGRPIQTTRDLPEFWRGSWRDVAKEMRGRYPKHNWPDSPWESIASLKTKKAQARGA